ncbi:hypothetical protein [Micrococcus luteus]|uniref:hypothetical protein n=1 Tax=Micrococcus luteus TaxID=1270 RepID=UPI003330A006
MSAYVTPARGHDATWLLQHVEVGNDLQLKDGRARYARLGHGDRGRDFTLAPTTPAEAAAATATVRRFAAQLGRDEDAVAEVLEALGLASPTRQVHPAHPVAQPPRPRKRKRTCQACGRRLHIRLDNTVADHDRPGTHDRCTGARPEKRPA